MKKIFIILLCLLLLTGCNSNNNTNDNEKIIAELTYFGMKIESLINSLNNISLDNYELVSEKVQITEKSQENKDINSMQGASEQGAEIKEETEQESSEDDENITITRMKETSILNADTEDINWDLLRSDMEELNSSWSIVILDLNNANVPDNDIIEFGEILNDCIISINSEDKINSLQNLSNLYAYIPQFLNNISAEKYLQNLKSTKNYIFKSYVAATQNDWNTVSTSLIEAENSYANILNNIDYVKDKEYKVNKTYLLIKELQNTISLQDKQIYFLKYKTLIESLNTMA